MNILDLLTTSAVTAALFIGSSATPAYADKDGQHTQPLRGIGTMRVVLAAGTIDCFAPDGTAVAAFPAEFDALARYTALGRTVGTITAERCDLDPATGSLAVSGVAYQTAANGDEVNAPYVGTFAPDFSFSLAVDVVGGTGRFAQACGAASAGGWLDPATGAGETWLDGWISTPGAGGRTDPCD